MSIVLDYTARIAPTALRAVGATGVCRYLAPALQKTAWKRIGSAEYAELRDAGIEVTLNWEFDARDWLGGSELGARHGATAGAEARVLGYPRGGVIPGSADFDMTRAEWISAGRGYAWAYANAVRAAGYRPGVYGPWDVLCWVADEGIMDAFWQAGMSRSWSGGRNANAWPGAHLRQRGQLVVVGQSCDWNEILIPSWGSLSESTVLEMTDFSPSDSNAWHQATRLDAFRNLAATTALGEPMPVVGLLTDLKAAAASNAATLAALTDLLTKATTGDGSLDTAAVKQAIADEHEVTRQLLSSQHAEELAALHQQHTDEVAALRAQLDALTQQ